MMNLLQTLLQLKTATDSPIEIPGLVGQAEPHQRVGVTFAVLAKRSLLAFQVGLGKTFMSIATNLKLKSMGLVQNTLVICQSGKRYDWQDEYERFGPSLRTILIEGPPAKRNELWLAGQRGHTTITSYESIRIDLLERQVLPDKTKTAYYLPSSLLQMLRYDLIVFDEVSIFKSWGTVLNLALGYLVNVVQPPFALGLSGTPIQKNVGDVFSVVDKLIPGYLGDKTYFDQHFTVQDKPKGRPAKIVGVKNVEVLRTLLAPIVLTGERDKIYPGRTFHRSKLCRVELTPEQIQAYDAVVEDTLPEMDQTTLLERFQRLEQIVDTLAWFTDLKSRASAKLDKLRDLLTGDLQDEKVVIFSKHLLPLTEAKELVTDPLKLDSIMYTGREDLKKREASRKRFLEDPDCKIAFISTAAEMGYNFHSAHYMIFLNHVHNPARVAQVIGRIDRPIVQTSGFICSIHMTAIGTFEERIIPKLHREAELARNLIGMENKFDNLKGEWADQNSRESLLSLIRDGRIPNREI